MGTSDSYVYQGGPSTKPYRTLTTEDPGWERKVAGFADAGIKSMREPEQSSMREVRIEPIAEPVAERATEIGTRLAAAASRHRPAGTQPAEIDRVLDAIVDEVFEGGEYGSGRIDSLVRECAVKAVSRWLRHQASEEPEPLEPIEFEEILVDPLGVVDPELVGGSEPLQQLMDEFHAELLVALIQTVGGEGMFPGLTSLKLLWALYRWAIDRLLRTRGRNRRVTRQGGEAVLTKDREREIIDDLLDLDESGGGSAGELGAGESANV